MDDAETPTFPSLILGFFSCEGTVVSDARLTELLEATQAGSAEAAGQLFCQTYPQLRELAEAKMGTCSRRITLHPTALVNEAVLRILKADSLSRIQNGAGFFALAARAMRSVLVDYARRRSAAKRGHTRAPSGDSLDELVQAVEKQYQLDMLILDEALEELRGCNGRQHEVVMLRFFGGLKFIEIAKELNLSLATVERDWYFARAWLRSRIDED